MGPKLMTEPFGICGTARTALWKPALLHTPQQRSFSCLIEESILVRFHVGCICPQDATTTYLACVRSSREAQDLKLVESQ